MRIAGTKRTRPRLPLLAPLFVCAAALVLSVCSSIGGPRGGRLFYSGDGGQHWREISPHPGPGMIDPIWRIPEDSDRQHR